MCQLLTTSLLSEVCKSQKLTVPAADFGRKLLSSTFFQTRPVLRPCKHNTSAVCGLRLHAGLSQLGKTAVPLAEALRLRRKKNQEANYPAESKGKASTRTKER